MDSSSKREQKEMRRAAQDRKNNLIAILFGLPFLAAGLGLSIYFGMAALAGMQPLQWRRVPCTIVSSSVVQDGPVNTAKYFASVMYAYKVDGVTRQSKTLSPLDKGFDDYYDAAKKVERYPAGASGTALVNPADASVAYLEPGPVVWNMLLIGLGISIVAMLAEVRLVRIALHPDRKYVAIGEQSWFVFSFLGAFMATGVAVAAFVSVPGMMRGFGAQSWPGVPCRVEQCEVRSQSSGGAHGSSIYTAAVLFRYEFKGVAHASSRYGLGSGSGLYATADSIVQSLKASPQTTCYVNPADPDDALLNRDLAGSMAFWMLFPVAFIGMPGLGLYGYVRNSRQKKARLAARHKHEQS